MSHHLVRYPASTTGWAAPAASAAPKDSLLPAQKTTRLQLCLKIMSLRHHLPPRLLCQQRRRLQNRREAIVTNHSKQPSVDTSSGHGNWSFATAVGAAATTLHRALLGQWLVASAAVYAQSP